jgi:hypothetical protein
MEEEYIDMSYFAKFFTQFQYRFWIKEYLFRQKRLNIRNGFHKRTVVLRDLAAIYGVALGDMLA